MQKIVDYLKYLTDLVNDDKLSATTKDRKYYSLKTYIESMVELEYLGKNYLEKFFYKKTKRRLVKDYLTEEDMDKIEEIILQSISDNKYRNYAIFTLLRNYGLRRSDIQDLTWEDVKFQSEDVCVFRTKTQCENYLPTNQKICDALLTLYNISSDKKGYVFKSSKGNKLSNSAFTNLVKKYITAAKLNKDFNITSKTYRATFISNLQKQGVPESQIIYFTGHASTDTLGYYTRPVSYNLRKIINVDSNIHR